MIAYYLIVYEFYSDWFKPSVEIEKVDLSSSFTLTSNYKIVALIVCSLKV